MMETYYSAAYWGRRPESAQDCARRAETFFHLLSQCDPTYLQWYEQHNSVKRALQLRFDPTAETFVRFFNKKKYQLFKNIYTFAAWTGHEAQDQGGLVSFTCGSLAEAWPNATLLHFPSAGADLDRLLALPVLTGIVRAMVLAWEPDHAVVVSDDFRDSLSPRTSGDTFAGWLTYFSRQWGEIPALPPPVRVEPVEDKGTLITLGTERLSATNPEHLALGLQVQEILAQHGLLRDILPNRP